MSDWTMRPGTLDDLPAIRDCFGAVFRYQRPIECDRSLYHGNPAGEAITMIAEADGRVVGHFAALPSFLRLRGERCPSAKLADFMTRAEYRGQGIAAALAEACFDRCADAGIDALFAFTNNHSHGPLLKANFDHVTDITVAQRPLRQAQFTAGLRPRKAAAMLAGVVLPRGRGRGFVTENVATADAPLDEVWALWQRQESICRVDRSPQWWSYRFSSERGHYEWIIARSTSGDLASAVVLGWRDGRATVAEVVGPDATAIESAISATIGVAEDRGYTALAAATNRPEVLHALTRTGFLRRRRLPLIVRRISYRTLPANVHTPDSWSISPADLDNY